MKILVHIILLLCSIVDISPAEECAIVYNASIMGFSRLIHHTKDTDSSSSDEDTDIWLTLLPLHQLVMKNIPIIDNDNSEYVEISMYSDNIISEEEQQDVSFYWTSIASCFSLKLAGFYLVSFLILYGGWKRIGLSLEYEQIPDEVDCISSSTVMYGDKMIYPGDLIRPLQRIELMFASAGFRRSYITNQAIWLRSRNPIDEKIMLNAITTIAKKYPQLQLCLALKRMQLWLKRMNTFKIDFEVVKGVGLDQFTKEFSVGYNCFRGPLWRVKLVMCKEDIDCLTERRYKAVLIFSVHHSITDGVTNNTFCRETIMVYNQLVLGPHITPAPVSLPRVTYGCNSSLSLLQTITILGKMIYNGLSQKYNVKCISPQNFNKAETKIVFDQFTEEETKIVIARCKREKITVNSMVTTAAAFTFVRTIDYFSDKGCHKLGVTIGHMANIRRLLQEKEDLPGCLIGMIMSTPKVNLHNAEDFWNVARRMQDDVTFSMIDKYVLTYSSIFRPLSIMHFVTMLNRYIYMYEYSFCHFFSTNMGDISEQLPPAKESDSVEIYDILRAVSGPAVNAPFLLTFHTFRKRMMFSVDYNVNRINDEAAKKFFAMLLENIRNVSKHECLPI